MKVMSLLTGSYIQESRILFLAKLSVKNQNHAFHMIFQELYFNFTEKFLNIHHLLNTISST